jgi:hypothetical protein
MDTTGIVVAVISTIVGSVLSAVATWYYARYYYRRAGHDLDAVSAEARRAFVAIARAMERGEPPTFTCSENGSLTGIQMHLRADGRARSATTATLTLTKTAPVVYDRQHEQPPGDGAAGE